MEQYLSKNALVEDIKKLIERYSKPKTRNVYEDGLKAGRLIGYEDALYKINSQEMKDPYKQCVQYPTIRDGIKAHAETYSFNIESELFNQLTKEQQKLWRKEIEQACISGGDAGYLLARDTRYKENQEVKEDGVCAISENLMETHECPDITNTSNIAQNKPTITLRLKKTLQRLYNAGMFKLTNNEKFRIENL